MVGLIVEKQPSNGQRRRHIPREMVEEILLNLPLKSLGQFSSVSKEWKSMIFNLDFIKRHRVRATRPGRERIIGTPTSLYMTQAVMLAPRRRMFQHTSTVAAPVEWGGPPHVHALCDGLFLVGVDNDLFLWNPAVKSYKKLPPFETVLDKYICGLGYDSISDDYKVLFIPKRHALPPETELYSLKSNSWRKIPSFLKLCGRMKHQKCAFFNGKLLWVDSSRVIVSFDLSTEEYVELTAPTIINGGPRRVEVSVLKGKVCVTQVYWKHVQFVLWSMKEDCTWQMMAKVKYSQKTGEIPFNGKFSVRPIYVHEGGNIVMHVSSTANLPLRNESATDLESTATCLYKPRNGTLKNLEWSADVKMLNAYLYTESLVSPHSWPLLQPNHL